MHFFHRQRGPTRWCALWVARRVHRLARSFVFGPSGSRTNGDIANGRAASSRPITNHSRGTIKQNRGKKFPSKVSRFICTQRGPAELGSLVAYNRRAKIELKAECCGKKTAPLRRPPLFAEGEFDVIFCSTDDEQFCINCIT